MIPHSLAQVQLRRLVAEMAEDERAVLRDVVAQVAAEADLPVTTVEHLRNGYLRQPKLWQAAAIEDVTGIEMRMWLTLDPL